MSDKNIKKPHASETSKLRARNNIATKIEILKLWSNGSLPWQTNNEGSFVRDGNGDKIVEWYPRNHAEFCRWTGNQCSSGTQTNIGNFTTLSRNTLYAKYNQDLRNKLDALYPLLNNLKDKMLAQSSNISIIHRLEKEISYWKSLAEAEATYVLSTLQKLDELDRKYRHAERLRTNNEAQYQEELDKLKAENASLNQMLKKIAPLKGI